MTEIRPSSLDFCPPCQEAAPRAASRRRPDALDPENLRPWRAKPCDRLGALVTIKQTGALLCVVRGRAVAQNM
jgi:hypothetical protein